MSLMDRLLDLLGLQRKSQASQTPVEHHQENVLESSTHKQHEAVTDLVAAMFEQKTALIKEFTQKIRSGELTEQEYNDYLVRLFGKADTSELSPSIQEALKDALEKRGREDQEE